MQYIFFYMSALIMLVIFIISIRIKPLKTSTWMVGIASVGYSLTYEIIFGDRLNLYYYINPGESTLYIVLGGLLLYPVLNMLYVHFQPQAFKPMLIYTSVWIVAMLGLEQVSFLTETVVLTGWKPFPWSIVTYLVTYLLINLLKIKLEKRCIT